MSDGTASRATITLTADAAKVRIESSAKDLGMIMSRALRCAHDGVVESLKASGYGLQAVSRASDCMISDSILLLVESLPEGSFRHGRKEVLKGLYGQWLADFAMDCVEEGKDE